MMRSLSIGLMLTFLVFGNSQAESERDSIEALENLCHLGSSYSCYNVGIAHLKGDGIKQSDKRAFPYFQSACKMNLGEGCNAVASMIYLGLSTNSKPKRALEIWDSACTKGDDNSCRNSKMFANQLEKSADANLKNLGVGGYICDRSKLFKCNKTN